MNEGATTAVVRFERLSSEALSSIFARLELIDAQGVHGRYELMQCDDFMFVRATTGGGVFHVVRTAQHLKRSPCNACFICLPLNGQAMLNQYGRDCTLGPGDIGILDAQTPYAIEISSGCDAIWVRVPSKRLNWPLRTMRSFVARRVDGASGVGKLASHYIRTLFEQMPNIPAHCRPSVSTIMVDLVSEAIALAVQVVKPAKSASCRTLERARIFIERHLGEDDLSPTRIAAGVGISRRYLSDLFASEEMTTMRHVTLRRLERCREALLQETWRPGIITQLAFGHGFVNLSSFNRSFKSTYGITPRQMMVRTGTEALACR